MAPDRQGSQQQRPESPMSMVTLNYKANSYSFFQSFCDWIRIHSRLTGTKWNPPGTTATLGTVWTTTNPSLITFFMGGGEGVGGGGLEGCVIARSNCGILLFFKPLSSFPTFKLFTQGYNVHSPCCKQCNSSWVPTIWYDLQMLHEKKIKLKLKSFRATTN